MKLAVSNFLQNTKAHYFIIAAVACAVMLPILFNGIPYGYDLPHHFQCAFSFYEGIVAGDFYPSWSATRNYGFGGMELRLYPPISHYSLALFYLVAQDWHLATWLTVTFYSVVGSFGVYLWARELMPSSQAAFAGCVYALMPYHLNQIYNTFFYAEYVGSAVLPFSFWFIHRVCKRGKASDVFGLAISFAVLILTHLPLTIIAALCFSIYGLSLLRREQIVSQVFKLSGGAALGLAASSFFWIKVIQERDLLAKTLNYPDPWLDYRLHFLLTPVQSYIGELQTRIYETSAFFYDLMLFYAVLLTVALTVPFMIRAKGELAKLRGVWLLFLASIFLAVPFSRFVWDALPLLQEVQFPWRWLSIVSLSGSVLAASHLPALLEWFQNKKRPLALIVSGCFLAFVAFSISQVVRQAPFIPVSATAATMENARTDIGFTFWWTIWTQKEAFENRARVSAGNREIQIQNWQPTERGFQISQGDSEFARIATFYHPNWRATVNEIPVEIKRDENGTILIPLSSQDSSVNLVFRETFAVRVGGWITVTLWFCLLTFGVFWLKRKLSLSVASSDQEKLSLASINFWRILLKIYKLSESKYAFALLVGVAVLTLLPMITIGIFEGGDLYQHIQFATTFQSSINNWDFYPRWGAAENLGYGGLGVRFYPPLTPFLLATARILSGDWHTATWLTFLFFTIVGGIGVYLWAKEFMSSSEAIWAGIIFILMPYHLIEIHNASMYAEFAGCSVVSFSFLFVTRICRRGYYGDVLGLAISYAILIFTHLPTTVIGSLCLLVYAFISLPRTKIAPTFFKLTFAVMFGVSAASIYWVKMVSEMNWLRNTKFWHDQHFDYNINFLLTSPWIDNRQLWFFNFVMLSLIVLVVGAVVAIYRQSDKTFSRKLRGVTVIFFLAIFMTTVLSKPIWATLPYLHEVQFPWRWLTIGSVCGSLLAAAAIKPLINLAATAERQRNMTRGFVVNLIIFFTLIYGLIWIGFQLNNIPLNQYESWVVDKSQAMGAEWFWTTKTSEKAFEITEKVVAEKRQINIDAWQPYERSFTVEPGSATDARIATLFYPHWQATVNNQPAEVKLSDDGAMLVSLPAETAKVKIWFREPLPVKIALFLSLFMWLCFGFVGLFLICQSKFLRFGDFSKR